jgi:hypothetical protein
MIAIFWARYRYLNRGMPSLLEHLASHRTPDVRVIDVTRSSIPELSEVASSATVIAVDQSIYNASAWAEPGTFSIYYIVDQRPQSYYQEALEVLLTASVAKLFMTYFDLHDQKNLPLLAALKGRVDAISWLFEKRPRTVGEVPPQYLDDWMRSHLETNTTWQQITRDFPVRIELPFAIERSEFFRDDAAHVWDVCVPGASYATRRVAAASARGGGLRVPPFGSLSRVVGLGTRAAARVLPPRRASDLAIRLQHQLQASLTRTAPVSFVCGSGLAYPVRKFFEIPAARALMIAYPCVGFEDYGFRDGVNVVVAPPEDLGQETKRLIANDGLRRSLTVRAYDLVMSLHTVERRSADLIECLRRLGRSALRNAQFVGGRYEIT